MNKNHKGFALITVLLIVFGITIISGGAYYLGMKNSTQNKIQNNLDTITPLVDKKILIVFQQLQQLHQLNK